MNSISHNILSVCLYTGEDCVHWCSAYYTAATFSLPLSNEARSYRGFCFALSIPRSADLLTASVSFPLFSAVDCGNLALRLTISHILCIAQ